MLQSLGFDPPEIEDGGQTTLLVQASDDLSGVKTVRGLLRSPSGAANLQFASQIENDSGATAFRISVPSKAETGLWYVSSLSLADRAGNSVTRQFTAATAPAGGTLRVVSSESDSAAPEVLQIWIEKATVDGGEKNLVTIEARDDRSEVASIHGVFRSASGSAFLGFGCTLNTQSGFWEGMVSVPANADCGEWTLHQLTLVDKAGNTAHLRSDSPPVAGTTFYVASGSECDSTAPVLEAFEVSPTIVSGDTETEILVTAVIREEGSGTVHVDGWFAGPVSSSGQVPRYQFYCRPTAGDPGAPWTGRIKVPQYAPKGTWKVGTIRLQDKALNFRLYTAADPVVAGSVFEVQ